MASGRSRSRTRRLAGRLREDVAHRAAGADVVPVHPDVVDDQHVGAGVDEPVGDVRQAAGDQPVVTVDEPDVLADGPVQPDVAGRTEADVLGEQHRADPGVAGRVLGEDLAAVVREASSTPMTSRSAYGWSRIESRHSRR